MYGAQTFSYLQVNYSMFENDVEMYGAQTGIYPEQAEPSLRMM